MKVNKEVEFNNIVNDILKNENFIKLKYELHHGISRMDHSLHVAKMTYSMCKKLKIKKYKEVVRAALLHDFYTSDQIDKHAFVNHPTKASDNASAQFSINDFQKNIIGSHMFPMCKEMPKSKESLLVSLADKIVALYECAKYKAPLQLGITLVFFINFMCIQR